jgi:chorismate-pyruvate lyase
MERNSQGTSSDHDAPSSAHGLSSDGSVSLSSLIHLYYPNPDALADFRLVSHNQTPTVYQQLLSHISHMTVTVERFYGQPLDVSVLRSGQDSCHYFREILLRTQHDQKVVQYGIVRLHLNHVPEAPRREILEEKKPLGRVLIEHNVLREIELCDLFEVTCGPYLSRYLEVPLHAKTYGRTAMLHCNGEPAIELLEIVAPVMENVPFSQV